MGSSTSTSGSERAAGAAPATARAWLYDGRGSAPRELHVSLAGRGPDAALVLHTADGTEAAAHAFRELRIGERIGAARRFVELPGGATLEVLDDEAFDALLGAAGQRAPGQGLRGLEQYWRHALVALLAVVALSWAFLRHGAPLLANRAVAVLPPSVDAQVGAGSLELMDETLFSPTTLPATRQAALQRLFAEVAAGQSPEGLTLRLELRGGGRIGANALALPSGTIVLTDELEALVEHDDELRAVFAHEIGHVVGRHAMRKLLQQSSTALLAVGLLGDVGSATVLVSTVPTVLVNAAYSRDFEREADAFAYRWMASAGVSPRRLGDLLARLVKAQGGGGGGGYLATHPDLAERVRAGRGTTTDAVDAARAD